MNREELLLTPEEVKDISGYGSYFFIKPYLEEQLNKIFNPERKNKPDGKGWWWQELLGVTACFNLLTGEECHIPGYMEYRTPSEGIGCMKIEGKWSKAIVPELAKQGKIEVTCS